MLRLTGDLAPRVVDELRGNLRSCADYVSVGPVQAGPGSIEVEATHRWRIVYERFAGDDSLVFAHDVDAVELSAGGPAVAAGDLPERGRPGRRPGDLPRLERAGRRADRGAPAGHPRGELAVRGGQPAVLSYSGMLPCFFGGSVSRLVRSARSARTICTRVSDGVITAST